MESRLPKNWIEINLKDSVNFRKGKKPKILLEVDFDNSLPYMDIQALEYGTIRYYADKDSSKHFKDDDVVIVWDGSRSGLVLKPKKGAIGSTLGALSPYIYKSEYLYYFLLGQYEIINSKARGVGIPHVDPTYLWGLSLPLPPLPEQERIVAKLDALFAQHEAMKKALKRIPQLLKDFRKQVLMQAITGELTVGWRDEKKISKNKMYLDEKVKILSDSLLPMKSPKSWNLIHLGYLLEDLTDYHANGSYEILKENVTLLENKSYAAMIRSTNFEKSNFNDLLIYINEKAYNFLSKSKLYGGEILISKIGNAGSVYFMPKLDMPSSLAMNLFMLRINNRYNNKYIYYHLISEFSKENTNKYVRGVTTKSIDKISVRSLTINLPPFEEQQEIVTRIESLFLKADIIEKRYKVLKEKIDSLPQAILHKAFKGELVPQLPTDGDAKDLLKEILKLKNEVKKK